MSCDSSYSLQLTNPGAYSFIWTYSFVSLTSSVKYDYPGYTTTCLRSNPITFSFLDQSSGLSPSWISPYSSTQF